MVYLIGSLRNPKIPEIAKALRAEGLEVFDDWFAAGPQADDAWRDYERGRGHDFRQALQGYAAQHVFAFDLWHLRRAAGAVLALPAGKSAHLEFGWMIGQEKPGVILLDSDPDRYDVMSQFATAVVASPKEAADILREELTP